MEEEKKSSSTGKYKVDRKWFSFSNISTVFFVLVMALMFFNPNIKAYLIQGLMKVGLFQPDVSDIGKVRSKPVEPVYFTDAGGQTVALADLKGKVVFINFWATWCPPCIAEMPSINGLYLKYRGSENVVFIMVDVDGKVAASSAFLKRRNLSLPLYIPASAIPAVYFSGSLPTTVILDKSGDIAFHHIGGADYSNVKVSALIDKLVK